MCLLKCILCYKCGLDELYYERFKSKYLEIWVVKWIFVFF